jgi:hypothetical protein
MLLNLVEDGVLFIPASSIGFVTQQTDSNSLIYLADAAKGQFAAILVTESAEDIAKEYAKEKASK